MAARTSLIWGGSTPLPIPPVTYYVITARRCSAAAMPAPFTFVDTMAIVEIRNVSWYLRGENTIRNVHGEVSLVGARSRANSQGDFACAKAAVLKTN